MPALCRLNRFTVGAVPLMSLSLRYRAARVGVSFVVDCRVVGGFLFGGDVVDIDAGGGAVTACCGVDLVEQGDLGGHLGFVGDEVATDPVFDDFGCGAVGERDDGGAGAELWVPKTSSALIKPRLGLTVAPGMIFGHVPAPRVLDYHAGVLVAAPVTSR